MTRAVLDSLLESEVFGPRIDAGNIGITGHSMGGFTALALAGFYTLPFDNLLLPPNGDV